MSEHILRIKLSEVNTVRISRKGDEMVIEVPLSRLDNMGSEFQHNPSIPHALAQLKRAINDLQSLVDVEFSITVAE